MAGSMGGAYVVGFIFDLKRETVVLMEKKRPDWQRGKQNGIGGKIELGESPVGAMVRECREETGLETTKDDWLQFHFERHVSGTRLYFYCMDKSVRHADVGVMQTTDEVLLVRSLHLLSHNMDALLYNLPFLLPMALTYLTFPEHRYLEG